MIGMFRTSFVFLAVITSKWFQMAAVIEVVSD